MAGWRCMQLYENRSLCRAWRRWSCCTHSLSSGGVELESTGSSKDDLPAILIMAKARGKQVVPARPWGSLGVALEWPWDGSVLHSICLVGGFRMALGGITHHASRITHHASRTMHPSSLLAFSSSHCGQRCELLPLEDAAADFREPILSEFSSSRFIAAHACAVLGDRLCGGAGDHSIH